MGYLNPIEVMGYQKFAKAAAEAGVDGVLTVDLPPEEADGLLQELEPAGIAPIFLIAPTSTKERIRMICNTASGFVYYVAVKGITGASDFSINDVATKVAAIRQESDLPVGIGFGIKDAASAKAAAEVGDAVIVGSAIVARVEQSLDDRDAIVPEISGFLSTLRASIDLV
jgi:tryptophan synthase alpha chain